MTERLTGKVFGIPIPLVITPRDGEALTDRWWAAYDGRIFFYKASYSRGWRPQCNSDARVAEKLVKIYPGAKPTFLPVAFIGPWDENWGYMLTKDLIDAAMEVDL